MEILKAYATIAVASSTSTGGDETIFRALSWEDPFPRKNQHIDFLLEEYVGTSHPGSYFFGFNVIQARHMGTHEKVGPFHLPTL